MSESPVTVFQASRAISNSMSELAGLRAFVAEAILKGGFPGHHTNLMQLAIEEAVTNLIEHGFSGLPVTPGRIRIVLAISPATFCADIEDDGTIFDPQQLADPNVAALVNAGHNGGLGVFMMRRIMDVVDYHAEHGAPHRLRLMKHH